ncbi:hypothetical protein PQX77_008374, partial [Marasmius sp. AFHP31]
MANNTYVDAEYTTLGLIILSSIGVQEEYQRSNLDTPVSQKPLTPLVGHLSALLLGSALVNLVMSPPCQALYARRGFFPLIASQITHEGKAGEDIQRLALRAIQRNTKE